MGLTGVTSPMTFRLFGALGVLVSLALPARAEFQPQEIAILQGLDKITARVTEFQVPVGQRARFGALMIHVQACFATPPTEPPESAAFVKIDELKSGGRQRKMLSGWIYASSPAIHALEHPVYDVWVKECVSPEPPPADRRGGDPSGTEEG